MISTALKALRPSRDAVADAMGVIDQLREANAEKRAELRRIAEAAQPVEAALAVFDQWLAATSAGAADAIGISGLLDPQTAAGAIALPRMVTRVGDHQTFDYDAATRALLSLVVATSGPAIRKLVADRLGEMTVGRETMTESERTKKLTRMRAELAELEAHEELAIRDLEAVGVHILRRADADPRAVLAHADSLPS